MRWVLPLKSAQSHSLLLAPANLARRTLAARSDRQNAAPGAASFLSSARQPAAAGTPSGSGGADTIRQLHRADTTGGHRKLLTHPPPASVSSSRFAQRITTTIGAPSSSPSSAFGSTRATTLR